MQTTEEGTTVEEIYLVEELNEQGIQDNNHCYRWIPFIRVNKSTPVAFDNDLCKKFKRDSIYIESSDEWKFVKKLVTEASHEFILEMKVIGSTGLNVLLGGVERFGKMSPKLIYDKHLKGPNVDRHSNSSCKRYVIVAQWPELSGMI
ncbi:unnamed protein product [Acanthocheilonema viteae]|uniref:Uncharacterized protein n=1 Tax=Acanthocheilonema viteae TaxID=6277 RepID=A0A498SLM5_ACAVI|nr:unnamed protein product [Acanthocheilonema viteae]